MKNIRAVLEVSSEDMYSPRASVPLHLSPGTETRFSREAAAAPWNKVAEAAMRVKKVAVVNCILDKLREDRISWMMVFW